MRQEQRQRIRFGFQAFASEIEPTFRYRIAAAERSDALTVFCLALNVIASFALTNRASRRIS